MAHSTWPDATSLQFPNGSAHYTDIWALNNTAATVTASLSNDSVTLKGAKGITVKNGTATNDVLINANLPKLRFHLINDVPADRSRLKLEGEPPSPLDPLSALRFLPSRLPVDPMAEVYRPQLEEVAPGHRVSEFDPR